MNRKELIKCMETFTGCHFITRKQVAAFMGYKDPRSIDPFIKGLPRVGTNYFINDVATAISAAAR